MTPEQELVVKRAEAVARAEASAKAEADATAQAQADNDAAQAQAAASTPSEIAGAAKGFVRGAGRAIAGTPEIASHLVTSAINAPTRMENAGVRPEGEGFVTDETPPAVQKPLVQAPTPISDAYNWAFPPDPNHPVAEFVGGVAAPAIVEAGLTGGTSLLALPASARLAALPAIVARNTGRAAATTGGQIAGSKTGEFVDESLGGSGKIGSVVGGAVGGGVAPGFIQNAPIKTMSSMFTDDASAARLAAYDKMRGADLPTASPDVVSMGLVGNKRAGQVEDATAAIPFAGGPAYRARAAQHQQMDAASKAVAEIPRGGPSIGNLTPSAMGQNVMDTAEVANKSAQAAQEAAFAPMKAQIGPDTVLPSKTLPDALDRLSRGATVGADKPTYDYFGNLVGANARAPLESGAPKVMDPALEASLQAQLARAQANFAVAKPGSPLHKISAQSISDLTDAISANRNPTYENLIKLRTKSANPLDPAENFDFNAHMNVKSALTDAQKEVAASKGVSPAEFDAVNAEYGRLKGQRDFFDTLRDKTGQGNAYSAMMSGGGRHNADQIAALAEHAPTQTNRLMADELELKLRGQRNAGGPPSPEGIAPQRGTAPNWFSSLPDQTREIMSGVPPNQFDQTRLNALLQIMDADARRPSRTIPGAGGNTLGLGGIFNTAAGIGGATLSGLSGGLAGVAIPTVAADLTGRALTSPWLTRSAIAARDTPWIGGGNTLARIMAAAYGGGL